LFKHNEIATGSFLARAKVDLRTVKVPMFLLGARDDELVAVEQLFATQRLVSTPPGNIRKAVSRAVIWACSSAKRPSGNMAKDCPLDP
jgi:poly(3-hydroxyalkanoate) synthetase